MIDRIDQLMDVMETSFDPHWREAWSRSQVLDSLSFPHTYEILIDERGHFLAPDARAAGFVLARRAPGEVELLLLAIRPEMRRRGLGRKLLALFEDSAREFNAARVFLEMREGNEASHLYRDAGYEPIGRRPAYYRTRSGETIDAITLTKPV